MLELIEDSLGRLLDDAAPAPGHGAGLRAEADAGGDIEASAESNARSLIEDLHEAGMLDVLAIDAEGEMPLAWRDAARLFMLIGTKAPDAPVADAILARALLGAAVDSLPPFTVLATQSAGLTIAQATDGARISGTLDGVPWGEDADAAVACVGGHAAGASRHRVALLARSAASEMRSRGTGV
nr:hypothetical protein [Burkholderiaceae bacterium]